MLNWIKPQSRVILKVLTKRNYDVMTPQAQRNIDWVMLAVDAAGIIGLIALL